MKISIQSILLVIMMIHSSVHGMKKIKIPKGTSTRFLGINAKNFGVNPEYQKTGDSFLPKDTIDSGIHQPVKVFSKPQQPSIPSGIKMKKMPSSAWEAEKRSYSTLGNTPFRKDFGLLDVKTAEAKQDLQKRGYSTTEVRKTDFLKKITSDLEHGKTSFLEDELVRKRVANLIRSKSMQKFAAESEDLSSMKKKFIDVAKDNGIYIPIDASEAVRLAYKSKISQVKELLKKEYQPFLPMIDRVLVQENSALERERPVLYHAVAKYIYKYMYFTTKIMELYGLSYPGFLMLRPSTTHASKKDPASIRNDLLAKGVEKDKEFGSLVWYDDGSPENRYHLLSTSNSLFTELFNGFEGPLEFFARSKNLSSVALDLKTLCKEYQLEDYYPKIEAMFENTDIKSDGGILLQFIFNKRLFNKTVYAAEPYGRKRKDSSEVKANIINSLQELDDETLKELQFRIVLTSDYLLNPQDPEVQKGLDIKVYGPDEAALYEYHKKIDDFFAIIKKEMGSRRKNALKRVGVEKEEPQQKTRTWSEYVKSFFTGRGSGQTGKK